MYTDERIAALEKIVNGSREPIRQERWRLRDIMEAVDAKSVLRYQGLELAFEAKRYFQDRVELLQIRDFYTETEEKETQLYLHNDRFHVSNKVQVYADDTADFTQWIGDFQGRCRKRGWKMLMQSYKEDGALAFGCCEIKSFSRDFYNVLFQTKQNALTVRGVYSCLYGDRKKLGVLLEALVRRNFGQ